jgi:HEPN domain-containing protein
MKPDPVIEAGRWLAQARDDLACARYALGGAFYAQACFVAQQASEEGMKSLACLEGARYVRGHSIAELVKGLIERYPQLDRHVESPARLDLYYVSSRYPNSHPGAGVEMAPFQAFTQDQAKEAVGWADGIIGDVAAIVES